MKAHLLKLLSQPSTWRGIVLLLTALGAEMNPGMETQIITAGVAFAGILGAAISDT